MSFLHAIILGIIEGATEFLPISSTFHLIWSANILGILETDFTKLFEVFIQAGAVLAVIFLYFDTITTNSKLMLKVLVSFIPTAVVGLLFYKLIKSYFFTNDMLQLYIFLLIGIIFILYEWFGSHRSNSRKIDDISYVDAVYIGLAQALAVIPGVSRAGAVIIALMVLRYRREDAAKYSFLLAIPTIFAASGLDLFKMRSLLVDGSNNVSVLAVGTLVSFLSATVFIKWFIKYLQNHSLESFGWYRIILFAVLLLIFY